MAQITEFIRALVRPFVTFIFTAVIAQIIIEGIDAPQWFIALAYACIGSWFGLRTFEKIRNNKVK